GTASKSSSIPVPAALAISLPDDVSPAAPISCIPTKFSEFIASKQASIKRFSRSEEHTSELQSRFDLVCRLLLEKRQRQTYYRCLRSTCRSADPKYHRKCRQCRRTA